ncbi:MAG: elongation factor G [Erysipelotrichaceae bacterium]|nr:elongation factor G [Erysipelotrichaceae bacterium]
MAKTYLPNQIKNISLMGHQGTGKTSLLEAILFAGKKISARGKVESGNTVSDFTKEEKDAKMTIYSAVSSLERGDVKMNFLDTPGFFDFVGEVLAPLSVSSVSLVVVRPKAVEVGTKRTAKFLKENKKPCIIVVNKLDKDNSEVDKAFASLQELFNGKCVMMNEPSGIASAFTSVRSTLDDHMDEITEKVANCDDEIMMKFLEGEEISADEVKAGLPKAIAAGELIPVLFTSASTMVGVEELVDFIATYAPAVDTIEGVNNSGLPSALVYKTVVDPFQGRISYVFVKSGKITANSESYNVNKQSKIKIGVLGYPNGKDIVPTNEIVAGDIGVVTKVDALDTNDTFGDASASLISPIRFPQPVVFFGIKVDNKNDEPKVSDGLKRASVEDLTISVERVPETKQLLVGCQGGTHIDTILNKIKATYKCQATTEDAKVPYRETIKGTSDVEGKHKKQSGGAGQYGDVWIRFSPSEKEFEFVNSVFGGSVPTNFIPAVEKGLIEACKTGILTGNPVVNIKCDLYDGGYHPVDSNEISFKIAASLAFKAGMEKAKPILLEPILKMTITVPNEFVGDVMSNVSKHRGLVGEFSVDGDNQVITSEIPQIELSSCVVELKTLTQAQADITHEFLRYAEVPREQAEKIIASHKAAQA